jgi:hypothetical protein
MSLPKLVPFYLFNKLNINIPEGRNPSEVTTVDFLIQVIMDCNKFSVYHSLITEVTSCAFAAFFFAFFLFLVNRDKLLVSKFVDQYVRKYEPDGTFFIENNPIISNSTTSDLTASTICSHSSKHGNPSPVESQNDLNSNNLVKSNLGDQIQLAKTFPDDHVDSNLAGMHSEMVPVASPTAVTDEALKTTSRGIRFAFDSHLKINSRSEMTDQDIGDAISLLAGVKRKVANIHFACDDDSCYEIIASLITSSEYGESAKHAARYFWEFFFLGRNHVLSDIQLAIFGAIRERELRDIFCKLSFNGELTIGDFTSKSEGGHSSQLCNHDNGRRSSLIIRGDLKDFSLLEFAFRQKHLACIIVGFSSSNSNNDKLVEAIRKFNFAGTIIFSRKELLHDFQNKMSLLPSNKCIIFKECVERVDQKNDSEIATLIFGSGGGVLAHVDDYYLNQIPCKLWESFWG